MSTPTKTPDPCTNCGHCCSHFRVSFPWIETSSFWAKPVPSELTTSLTPAMSCMKGTELGGAPCQALDAQSRCSIYENRPSVCRQFHVWDHLGDTNPLCTKVRALHQLAPIPNLSDWMAKSTPHTSNAPPLSSLPDYQALPPIEPPEGQ